MKGPWLRNAGSALLGSCLPFHLHVIKKSMINNLLTWRLGRTYTQEFNLHVSNIKNDTTTANFKMSIISNNQNKKNYWSVRWVSQKEIKQQINTLRADNTTAKEKHAIFILPESTFLGIKI